MVFDLDLDQNFKYALLYQTFSKYLGYRCHKGKKETDGSKIAYITDRAEETSKGT